MNQNTLNEEAKLCFVATGEHGDPWLDHDKVISLANRYAVEVLEKVSIGEYPLDIISDLDRLDGFKFALERLNKNKIQLIAELQEEK